MANGGPRSSGRESPRSAPPISVPGSPRVVDVRIEGRRPEPGRQETLTRRGRARGVQRRRATSPSQKEAYARNVLLATQPLSEAARLGSMKTKTAVFASIFSLSSSVVCHARCAAVLLAAFMALGTVACGAPVGQGSEFLPGSDQGATAESRDPQDTNHPDAGDPPSTNRPTRDASTSRRRSRRSYPPGCGHPRPCACTRTVRARAPSPRGCSHALHGCIQATARAHEALGAIQARQAGAPVKSHIQARLARAHEIPGVTFSDRRSPTLRGALRHDRREPRGSRVHPATGASP